MTVKYLKDFYGSSAKLTVHNDGTATLKVSWEKKLRRYKNEKKCHERMVQMDELRG